MQFENNCFRYVYISCDTMYFVIHVYILLKLLKIEYDIFHSLYLFCCIIINKIVLLKEFDTWSTYNII